MPMNADGTYNTSYSSNMFRALDTHEISAGSSSMEDSLSDYATFGLGGAVISAGVGLYNTGAALGQAIGIAGKDAQIDEGDAINSLMGADAASFYGRHKEGIDATGLVLGSLVPGLAAIRGLRMLQLSGKVSTALEGATGLKNADIVMNSTAVEAAKKYALETTTAAPNWFSGPMIKAYAQGYKQQVMEAGAFEAATLVTMNQQATLNPDDLGYFTAIGDQFWDATKFAAFGGVLGGSIDALRIFGGVRKYGTEEYGRTYDLFEVRLPSLEGITGGNALLELGKEASRRAEVAKTLEAGDWFGRKRLSQGDSILKNVMLDTFADMNKAGNPGFQVLEDLVKDGSTAQLESIATVVSGMRELGNVSVKDLEELSAFYAKTRTPSMVVTGENAVDIAGKLADTQTEFMEVLGRFKPLGKSPDNVGLQEHFENMISKTSAGFALPSKVKVADGLSFNVRMTTSRADGESVLMIVPDFVGLNRKNITNSYAINKIYAEQTGKSFNHTPDSFAEYVLLHELGHVKNNSNKMTTLVKNYISEFSSTGEAPKVLKDLVTASVRKREANWYMSQDAGFAHISESDKVNMILSKLIGTQQPGLMNNKLLDQFSYLSDPAELLADGAAYVSSKATRELASKQLPDLAKLFDEEGSMAKAWNPTKAYYNSRTRQVYSSYLPGISDADQNLSVVTKGMDTKLVSPALGKSFQLNAELFQDAAMKTVVNAKADHLEFDAQWVMADRQTTKTLGDKEGVIHIAKDNLPIMEKVAVLAAKDPIMAAKFEEGKVLLNGQVVMKEAIGDLVLQRKQELRTLLAGSAQGYNENEIARMLNIDIPHAMGDNTASPEGWMLLGTKDYTKPEVFTTKYDHRSINDYQGAVMNMAGVSMLNDAVKSQRETTAALLTGGLYSKLPTMHLGLLAGVNPFVSRATLVSNSRNSIGSLRDLAAYTGKLVGQHILNTVQKIDESFAAPANKFNRTDAGAIRYELAQVDNILRREHYYHVTTEEGGSYIVRKDAFQAKGKELFGQYHPDMLHGMPDSEIVAMVGTGDQWAPNAVKLSDEVGEFFSGHSQRNASIVDRKIELGRSKGATSVLDRDVLYAPPRDLSKQKYFALVEPSVFKEGQDTRRFMIYGDSAAELESKKLAIQQKYGNDYNIDTAADRLAQMKAGKTEANLDAFDEMEFDSSLFRKGNSSELAPNADFQTSSTLERYRQWTIRQEESLVRSGVELKYSDLVAQLKRTDKEFAKQETNTLNKRWQEASTIWKDTLSTMLNKRARGSALEQEWVRVNDFVGEKGSEFLDKAFSSFRKFKTEAIDQKTLNDWNQKLDSAGYKSPFDRVAEVIMSSPDTQQSKLFPSTVRLLSKLISVPMLRLDAANSMLQLISTPILTLPVLMEAKQALKGTPAGARLEAATTVINPVTRESEPSCMKLISTAATKFHTDEGKLFAQELKDRNIITDELQRYHDVTDMSELNGRHTMKQVNDKIDKLAKYGSYLSAGNFAETYSRFVTAWAVKDLCEIRGLGKDEAWSIISGSVDKVHGVYAGAQRPQLFQGVIGQSVGLYQTYFFNYAQALMKGVAEGQSKQAATMLGMQASIFGIQSLPGFQTLNASIGEASRNSKDLYSVTNADSGESWGQYAMYGLASHMFGTPVDFSTRGSLAARNMLVIPTQFQDLPIVGTLSKVIGNIIDTGMMAAEGDVGIKRALIHGLAHNGMSRPLQGIGTIMAGNVTTATGQNNFDNVNRLGYDANADLNWAGMFARAIGTKPLNETIIQNAYFRTAAYKANTTRELAELGGKIQINAQTGEITPQTFSSFARDYEMAGGEPQTFNAYWGRQLKQADNGTMEKFRQEMVKGTQSELGRAAFRIAQKQSTLTPWEVEQGLEQ